MDQASFDPTSHYDRVTGAWGLLLGAELHYGVFEAGDDLPTATRRLTSLMVDAGAIGNGATVLDVGCGTGAPACDLADRGASVLGITTSSVGVAEATQRAAERGLADRATFEVRDGTDNGLPDATFDRVWVLESSHLMRNRAALISECARVLQPGGRVVLCDVMTHRELPFEEVRERRHEFALLRAVFGDAHMKELSTYVELAEANGLEVAHSEDLTDATRPTFAAWRHNAHVHRQAVVDELGEDDWQRFIDACDVLEALWDEGTFGYGLFAAVKS